MQTLLPGALIPPNRHLRTHEVLFIHKGQGRMMVADRSFTVVPGVMVVVPPHTWQSLRNTGTGTLQIIWMATPPGIELFLREFARQGPALDAAALVQLGQQHGIEFRAATEAPVKPPPRHRRHRRVRHRPFEGPQQRSPQPLSPKPPQPSPPAPPTPKPEQRPPSSTTSRPPRERARRVDHRRREHVKEVYMGGRWVKVSGDGPVISS